MPVSSGTLDLDHLHIRVFFAILDGDNRGGFEITIFGGSGVDHLFGFGNPDFFFGNSCLGSNFFFVVAGYAYAGFQAIVLDESLPPWHVGRAAVAAVFSYQDFAKNIFILLSDLLSYYE